MNNKKSSESRRNLLKSIAAGSGAIVAGKSLPGSWSKPVVDSVTLPAHAQTSFLGPFGGMAVRRVSVLTDDSDSMLSKTIENLVPEAAAQAPPETSTAFLCVTPSADLQSADVELILVANEGCFSQYFTVTGVPVGESTGFTTRETGCEYLTPAGLIDQLGLINKAHAGTGSSQVEVFLDSVTGGAIGRVMISGTPFNGEIHDFDLIDPCFDLKTKHCCVPAVSDIRLKTNIEPLSISSEGYKLYKFQYIGDDDKNTYVGVMAQDVISSHPKSVIQNESGFYMVRYDKLGLKMVTLDQWKDEGPDCVELIH